MLSELRRAVELVVAIDKSVYGVLGNTKFVIAKRPSPSNASMLQRSINRRNVCLLLLLCKGAIVVHGKAVLKSVMPLFSRFMANEPLLTS